MLQIDSWQLGYKSVDCNPRQQSQTSAIENTPAKWIPVNMLPNLHVSIVP